MGSLRIGVDATCWRNLRGYGRHARALLNALVRQDRENRYTFLVDSFIPTAELPPGVEIRQVAASAPAAVAASANGHRSLRDMWRMSRSLSKAQVDVLLFPTVYSYVPVWCRAKKVLLIHDVIAEKYPQLTLPRRLSRLLWRTKVALGRWQADALVTVSEHSRQGLVDHFRINPERIHVVGEANDPVFRVFDDPHPTPRLQALGLPRSGRSIIYVGGFSPHKNLEMLVAVFARLAARPEFADVHLLLVGEYEKEVFHSQAAILHRQVDQLRLGDRVTFTGFLPDEDLVVLLNRATVLALPSLLEGFGLPAIEAAACGCPVVATTASPLPGLLGRGGRFVEPTDQSGWESALAEVLASDAVRRQMREAGLAATRLLTWDAAAQGLLGILRKVAGG